MQFSPARLLCNPLLSDLTFVLPGGVKLPAHRLLLAKEFPVYAESFVKFDEEHGDAAAPPRQVIEVPHDEETWRAVLEFAYTGKAKPTLNTVVPMLAIAREHRLTALEEACVNYIKKRLRFDNIVAILRNLPEELKGETFFKSYLAYSLPKLIESPSFLELAEEEILQIVQLESSNLMEVKLFEGLQKWAAAKLPEAKSDERKTLLEPFLKHVKFPTFSVVDLAEKVVPSGLVSDEELVKLFTHCSQREAGVPSALFSGDLGMPRAPASWTIPAGYKDPEEYQLDAVGNEEEEHEDDDAGPSLGGAFGLLFGGEDGGQEEEEEEEEEEEAPAAAATERKEGERKEEEKFRSPFERLLKPKGKLQSSSGDSSSTTKATPTASGVPGVAVAVPVGFSRKISSSSSDSGDEEAFSLFD